MATPSNQALARILVVQNESTVRIKASREKIRWFCEEIRKWYQVQGRSFPWREPGCSQYEVVVAELLLWRTKAERVAAVFPTFVSQYSGWQILSSADEKELRAILTPLGYVDRVKTLLALARTMKDRELPSTRDELQQLPGVGQYVASAVLTICHGQREPLVDGNMARVLERFFGPREMADIRFDPYLQQLARAILPKKGVKEFNWAVLDFAALICTARSPKCAVCPLPRLCLYTSRQRQ